MIDSSITLKKKSKWNEEKIIKELKIVINTIGHFPLKKELRKINRNDLEGIITKNGGLNKFRRLLGYETVHKYNYWDDGTIINELEEIINKLGYFPKRKELLLVNRGDLDGAIGCMGGINKFRKLMGYEYLHKPNGYWSDDIIIKELREIINNINDFPLKERLYELNNGGLIRAIDRHGGLNKFRKLLGYDYIQKPDGYWTDETIIINLKQIISQIKHFPTQDDFILLNKSDLYIAISRNGGFLKFHNLLGYTSIQEKYKSELCSYTNKRGRSSEKFIKNIIIDYCSLHNLPPPQLNKKLSKGNVIEFICNTGRTIGIDVTNTRKSHSIIYKWTHKFYHKYLDELWVVVFSDIFTEQDYLHWNTESPPNVKIMSVHDFLKELDYSLDEYIKNKIDKYCKCTFHSKGELKK